MSDRYILCRDYVQRLIGHHGGPAPAAGSIEWQQLPDTEPSKLIAVLTAGTLWCLEQELGVLEDRRYATKAAAVEVSAAKDWTAVANRIRKRDEWRQGHPWADRRHS